MPVRQHLAIDIVCCVQLINEQQKKLAKTDPNKLSESVETVHEVLRDVEAKLCQLITQIITAPINGRLVMPYPVECLTTEQKEFSLYKQLNLDK